MKRQTARFLDVRTRRFCLNSSYCGLGKTHIVLELASERATPSETWIIMFPTHAKAREAEQDLIQMGRPDVIRMAGKNCTRGEEPLPRWCVALPRHLSRCADCLPDRKEKCGYRIQLAACRRASIVVTTAHNWWLHTVMHPSVMVFDESVHSMCIRASSVSAVPDWTPSVNRTDRTGRFFTSRTPRFDPVDDSEQALYFARQFSDKRCVVDSHTKTFSVIQQIPALKLARKVILNDATADPSLLRIFFGIDPKSRSTQIIQYGAELDDVNQHVTFRDIAGESHATESASHLRDYARVLGIESESDWSRALIITRKKLVKLVQNAIPETDVIHYGMGRGINEFKHKDIVLIHARYRLPDEIRLLIANHLRLARVPAPMNVVDRMEVAEMWQTVHRIRLGLSQAKRCYSFASQWNRNCVPFRTDHLLLLDILSKRPWLTVDDIANAWRCSRRKIFTLTRELNLPATPREIIESMRTGKIASILNAKNTP